jgi:predicted acyltransferase
MSSRAVGLVVALVAVCTVAVWATTTAVQQFAATLVKTARALAEALTSLVTGQGLDDPQGSFNDIGLLVVVLIVVVVLVAALVLRWLRRSS